MEDMYGGHRAKQLLLVLFRFVPFRLLMKMKMELIMIMGC